MDRLEFILKERKLQGVSWDRLAEGLPIKGNALRTAFSRNSVSKYYLEHIEKILNIDSQNTQDAQENYNPHIVKDGVKFFLKDSIDMLTQHPDVAKKHENYVNLLKVEALKFVQPCITEDGKFDLKKFLESVK